MFSNQKAFTLVELLIVVVIIGIMASLAIPRFTGQTEKARVAEAVNILSAMRRGQEVFFNENGFYLEISITGLPPVQNVDTSKWSQIGMSPPVSSFWVFGTSSAGTATAARVGTRPNECRAFDRITLTFNPASGADPWGNSSGCYGAGGPYHPAR